MSVDENSIDKIVEDLYRRFNEIEKQVESTLSKRSDSDLEELRRKIRNLVLEAVKAEIPDAVKDFISVRAEALEQRIQSLETEMKTVAKRVKSLEQESSRQRQDIERLKTTTNVLICKIADLEEEIDRKLKWQMVQPTALHHRPIQTSASGFSTIYREPSISQHRSLTSLEQRNRMRGRKIVFYASIPIPNTPIIGGFKAQSIVNQIKKFANELGCSVKIALGLDKVFLKIDCGYDQSAAMEVRKVIREHGGRIHRIKPTIMPFIFWGEH